MIGRAAMDNPWLFSRIDRDAVPPEQVRETILDHFDAMLRFYGQRGVITFRKYLKAYLAPYPSPKEDLLAVLKSKDPHEVRDWLARFFDTLIGR